MRDRRQGGRGRSGSALLAMLFALTVPLVAGLSVTQNAAAAAPVAASPSRAEAVRVAEGPGPVANDGGSAGVDQARRVAARAPSTFSSTSSATVIGTGAPAVDPAYPYAGYLRASITGITPTVVTNSSGSTMTVTGTMTNVSKGTLYDLRYVWQRGDALAGVAAIKAEIARPGRPSTVVGDNWRILGPSDKAIIRTDLAPGASSAFTAVAPIGAGGLELGQRGVFPLMIKVSGDVGQNGVTLYERVGEIHLLTTVLTAGSVVPTTPTSTATPPSPTSTSVTDIPTSGVPTTSSSAVVPESFGVPSSDTATAGAAPSGAAPTGVDPSVPTTAMPSTTGPSTTVPSTTVPSTTVPSTTAPVTADGSTPVGVNVLWPIVDRPHLGVSGVFLDDGLARSIAPGGRLYRVLQGLTTVGIEPAATTLVLDPELLTELGVMARGYRVSSLKGKPQAALTPVPVRTTGPTPTPGSAATGSPTEPATTVPATTVPATTVPGATVPATTVPGATVPGASRTTAPTRTTNPGRTGPAPSRPIAPLAPGPASTAGAAGVTPPPAGTPVPPTTAPLTTAPTAPAGTAPATTTPTTTAPTTTPTTTAPTTTAPPPPDTVAGTGQNQAITFLAMLQQAVADRQVLVLPYSDPDAVAMVRAGLDSELADLVATGRTVASRVLELKPDGEQLITEMAYPPGGAMDDATLAFFAGHGMAQALLSPKTVTHAGGAVGAVRIQAKDNGATIDAAVTDSDLLVQVQDFVARGTATGLAVRSSNLAALLAGGSLTGTGTPLILSQAFDFTPNTVGLRLFDNLLRTLQSGRAVAARPLTTIAAAAKVPATLTYPDTAVAAELGPGYLGELGQVHDAIAGMRASLERVKGDVTPIPADILDPLTRALLPAASVGLRANQFFGRSVLATAEETLRTLRAGVFITSKTSYTLAASTSPLVVTVRNDLPYIVKVRVVIQGGRNVGMTATDPGVLSIPAGRSQQFKINTEVVKAGRFQVRAQLLAADGADWDGPVSLTVSSSAYGTLTIILIAVAGGALFLLVVLRIAQRIRHRNDPPEDGSDGDPGGSGPSGPHPDSILAAANAPPAQEPGSQGQVPRNQSSPHDREGT